MRKMKRILSLDKENMVAVIEAGIVGLELHRELNCRGVTMGHEPDSWEFSTLGGWVKRTIIIKKRTINIKKRTIL